MIYFRKILAFSIGSDFDLLEQCSQSERYRHYIKGFFIILTSIISSLFISYAIATTFDSFLIVFLTGLTWFLVNFSIIKLLLIVLKSESINNVNYSRITNLRTKINKLFTVSAYLIFTFLISLIISYPIIFKVFDNDIQREINNLSNTEITKINNLKKDEIGILKKQEKILEETIKEQKEHLFCWQKLLTSEMTGIRIELPCGSTTGHTGYSRRSKKIENVLVEMKEDIKSSSILLNELKMNNNKKIELLNIKYKKIANETRLNYSKSFLIKSTALQKISNNEAQVVSFKYLVILFFVIFNMSPFFIVLIDTKKGNYEDLYKDRIDRISLNNYKNADK